MQHWIILGLISFRTLSRIRWGLTDKKVYTVTFKVLFPYPLEDFGGANAEWAKKRAKTFMFPSPREDFWGANEGLTEVANKAKEFPSPREDWGVLTGPSSYDCSSSV